MEEIELREALRQHVHTGEPPLGLTADALLNLGRRQQRWRIGLGVGSGGAATAIAIVGALTLTPLGGSGLPTLDDKACTLPLAPYSSDWPAPSPRGTDAPHYPSPRGSAHVPPVSPTARITDSPYQSPSPNPAGSANVPSADPTTTFNPSPGPVTPWPRTPQPYATGERPIDTPRAIAANCYLAREIGTLLPAAVFAPFDRVGPPMALHVMLESPSGEVPYVAAALAIETDQKSVICVTITPSSAPAGVTALMEGLDGEKMNVVRVNTGRSLIEVTVTNSRLTLAQLTRLANAPELDIFR